MDTEQPKVAPPIEDDSKRSQEQPIDNQFDASVEGSSVDRKPKDGSEINFEEYQRIGFHAALESKPADAREAFGNKAQSDFKESLDSLIKWQNDQEQNLSAQIDIQERRLVKLEEALLKEQEPLPMLEKRLEELREAMYEAEGKYQAVLENLGQEKRIAITQRIDDVRKQMESLVEQHQKLAEQHFGNSSIVKESRADLQGFFKRYQQSLEDSFWELKDRFSRVENTGMGAYTASFLVAVGIAAALVAGRFFAIYGTQQHLNNDNIVSFFIKGLFRFANQVFSITSPVGGGLVLEIGLIILLGLLTLLLMGLQALHIRKEPNAENNPISLPGKLFGSLIRTQVQAGSFLGIWFQVLPLLLVLGTAFVLLAVGYGLGSIDEIDRISFAMSGHFIGTNMALVCGGVAYLYISKIMEPRQWKQAGQVRTKRSLAELSGVLVLFVLLMLSLVFSQESAFDFQDQKGLVSLLAFLVLALMGGMALGYGLYVRGLIIAKNRTEQQLDHLAQIQPQLAREVPYSFVQQSDQQFTHNLLTLQNQLVGLMIRKNNGQEEVNETDRRKEDEANRLHKFFNGFRRYLGLGRMSKNAFKEEAPLSNHDQSWYPHLNNQLSAAKDLWERTKSDFQEVKNEIKRRRELNTEYAQRLRKLIGFQKKTLNDLKNARLSLPDRYQERKRQLDSRYRKMKQAFEEGFQLGSWIQQNQIGNTKANPAKS